MRIIDLRSDTKTLPTEEMLESIRTAKRGDDVDREDPTVNQLEELAAAKLGKEAGLLITSGHQGNLVAMMTHCNHGDEIFAERNSHLYKFETGSMSAIVGCVPYLLDSNRGTIDPIEFESAIRPPNQHFAKPTLLSIENTHNLWGGAVIHPKSIHALAEVAQNHDIAVHCDGARIFNAAIALEKDIKELVSDCDSVTFCLSKGLSAPVGAVLVGNEEFIDQARRNRKLIGGGMRQAGIIAAPGIVALEKLVDRLREDHKNAQVLSEGLLELDVFDILPVETNLIRLDVSRLGINASEFSSRLKDKGILANLTGQTGIRFVTYRGITHDDIEFALTQIENIISTIT